MSERLSIRLAEIDVPRTGASTDLPIIKGNVNSRHFQLPFQIRNDSFDGIPGITHVYLFTEENSGIIPSKYQYVATNALLTWSYSAGTQKIDDVPEPIEHFKANPIDAADGLFHQFRLMVTVSALPPGAVEPSKIDLMFKKGIESSRAKYRLRLHTPSQYHDFRSNWTLLT